MDQIALENVRKLCKEESIIWSQHVATRCLQRGIKTIDIENCLLNGEIIEKYLDDYPYCSYLILGLTIKNQSLHVICGIGDSKLWIITAYFPSLEKRESNFKKRKEKL
ncbi:MAG: DUF4258 domain-containing protein [Sedimentibacter sp.]